MGGAKLPPSPRNSLPPPCRNPTGARRGRSRGRGQGWGFDERTGILSELLVHQRRLVFDGAAAGQGLVGRRVAVAGRGDWSEPGGAYLEVGDLGAGVGAGGW